MPHGDTFLLHIVTDLAYVSNHRNGDDDMTKFRDLNIGDQFDFIGPDRMLNSFYARCVKLSARTYTEADGENEPRPMRVGSINVEVFHVTQGSI